MLSNIHTHIHPTIAYTTHIILSVKININTYTVYNIGKHPFMLYTFIHYATMPIMHEVPNISLIPSGCGYHHNSLVHSLGASYHRTYSLIPHHGN